jgi:hypothetical protein
MNISVYQICFVTTCKHILLCSTSQHFLPKCFQMSSVDGDASEGPDSGVDGDDIVANFVANPVIPRCRLGPRLGPPTIFCILGVLGGIYSQHFTTDFGLQDLDDGGYHLFGIALGQWELVHDLGDLAGEGVSSLIMAARKSVKSGPPSGFIVYRVLERCEVNDCINIVSLSPQSLHDGVRAAIGCLQTDHTYHGHRPLTDFIALWQAGGKVGHYSWKHTWVKH